jgi:hypothetical protein
MGDPLFHQVLAHLASARFVFADNGIDPGTRRLMTASKCLLVANP